MTDVDDSQSLNNRADDGRFPPQSEALDAIDDDPDEREAEMAAAAEVALLDGHFDNATNRTRRAAEEAVLGVAAVGDAPVEAYQATDESGRLVEQRFLQFLESL
jgi:hypothetical protein